MATFKAALTSPEGDADTCAVTGAAGTDITASTDYGSGKSLDGVGNVSTTLPFCNLH